MYPENSNIFTINGGSSSIKFAMYEMAKTPKPIFSGSINRIGLKNTSFNVAYVDRDEKMSYDVYCPGFYEGAIFLILWLKKQNSYDKVKCIGHRVVHGMEYSRSEVIDATLIKELKRIRDFDPEHLPAEIEIIELFKNRCPRVLQVACFDTAFHTTMPRIAKILPIPRRFDRAGVHKYGFHGLSYAFLMEKLKEIAGADEANGRIILAHLGNGASLAALKDGKSMDTSMGFTPAGGCIMGTRSGDLDPGVAWYMMNNERMDIKQFNHLINNEAGLLGVSETSADMQDLLKMESSDVRAAEAVALFCYQVKKWIGSFMTILEGLDTLIFSGGIGENAPIIRSRVCEGLRFAGIELDEDRNNQNQSEISIKGGKVKVLVIPTNEELMIAKCTTDLYIQSKIKNNGSKVSKTWKSKIIK
tara:strand:+ start:767 stop:2014 length:1248 start_codon:yes stop_codon:yes gene_type:complete